MWVICYYYKSSRNQQHYNIDEEYLIHHYNAFEIFEYKGVYNTLGERFNINDIQLIADRECIENALYNGTPFEEAITLREKGKCPIVKLDYYFKNEQ